MVLYRSLEFLMPFLEASMYFLLFEAFLERRQRWAFWQILIGVISLACLIGFCNRYLDVSFANLFGMTIVSLLAAMVFYNGVFSKKLMAAALCIVISGIFEGIVIYLIALFADVDVLKVIQEPFFWSVGMLCSKAAGLAICNIIRVKSRVRQIRVKKIYWLLFFFLFASVTYASFLIMEFDRRLGVRDYDGIAFLAILGLFFSTFFALYLYERMAVQGEALRFREQYAQQLKYQVRHLDDLLARQAELRRVKHDMANQLLALRGYLSAGDVTGGQAYVATLLESLDAISPSIHTGNTALDAILSTKKALAESRGIAFHLDVQVPEQLVLAPIDQCIIFGNALDNALEACARASDSDPVIALTLRQKGAKLLCKIANTAPPVTDLTTHKADKDAHGFGLRNITDTLAKYGSEPIIEQNNGQFILKFVIFSE